MKSPRVSVIVPAYNADLYLRDALESLLRQTFPSFEILVVDDGSMDQTREIAAEFVARDARVRLLCQQHGGVASARNLAANNASGEYLAWLDADDTAHLRRLGLQVQFMDRYPQVAAASGTILVTDDKLRPMVTVHYPTKARHINTILPLGNSLAASAAVIRASAYQAVGGCRTVFNGVEDYDLWLRLSEQYELANLPDLLAYYRVHAGQASSTRAERQVMSTVGAQLSARSRRTRQTDPYAELNAITLDVILQTAQSEREAHTLILEAAAGEATFLALTGQRAHAATLLDWAEEITRTKNIERRARARVNLARGLIAWHTNRRAVAFDYILRAVIVDPSSTARRLVKGIKALAHPKP